MCAYVLPLQMADRGDLWPYSTRAVESRGGKYKIIRGSVTGFRKQKKEVFRAVRNRKTGSVAFKKSVYNSCSTLHMLRTSCAQEKSAHRQQGRSRLATTGRKTLARTLPKWQQEELPAMGKLLDHVALSNMLDRARLIFSDPNAVGFTTRAMLTAA